MLLTPLGSASNAAAAPSPLPLAAPSASAATNDAMPQLPVDPAIATMLANVSASDLRETDRRLVAFGTRSAFSETLNSPSRGVFAARDYIAGRFGDIAKVAIYRMTVDLDTYVQPKDDRSPRPVQISSVYATLRGDDPGRATYVISSHYDSRNSDDYDGTNDAPGADDNGSATAAVIEAARVMASSHFAGTIIFACFDGEEQGLYGSGHFAKKLAAAGVRVGADFNNDIIGASTGHDGERTPNDVRLFSEALADDAVVRRVDVLGNENDSPSRELARFTQETDAAYEPAMHVNLIYRADRFLRGGDQESFTAVGFPAIRFVEQNENFDHQHQNVRTENGIQYGDLLQYVDFDYLARVTQLDVAALATIATAPAAPVVTMDARALGYTTALSWQPVPHATAYEVVWRKTYEPQWTHALSVATTSATIPLSKDDWLFGVRSVDAAGHRSVVSFPTPVTH
jgi:Zn-dependent M28 family amino/carboxypeptidase